ncbi:uridine kinase family protein [Brachybacterium hainanense]|uniref:Uridine kinase n=1 Tax=Brachybacterium hainanense TaxID=1541174 RepID=A0ABV6RG03_9MICO
MKPVPPEPPLGPWRPFPLGKILEAAECGRRSRPGRTRTAIAVDGRSASGKTTLAARLAADCGPRTALVHTDDLAWHEPLFGWAHLLRKGILDPFRAGEAISFAPPQWGRRGREGAIEIPADVELLVIEGVGSGDRSCADLLDLLCWVQSDAQEARTRGIARDLASGVDGDEQETIAFWDEWGAAEAAHLAADRPWERADLVICGTPPEPAPDGMVLAADRAP